MKSVDNLLGEGIRLPCEAHNGAFDGLREQPVGFVRDKARGECDTFFLTDFSIEQNGGDWQR